MAVSVPDHADITKTFDSQPACQWLLGGLGRQESDKLFIGPVGLIVYPWCIRVVAATLVAQLSGNPETRFLSAAREAKFELAVAGFESPSWQAIACGVRPARREPEDHEPGTVRRGWQHAAASVVEERARAAMFTRVSDQVKAQVTIWSRGRGSFHSNPLVSGSLASQTSSAASSRVVHADVAVSSTPLATIVLHGPRAGVLSRQGFSLESASARICRVCEDERICPRFGCAWCQCWRWLHAS